ncbi:MAG: DUF3108 domain-containing protein [Cyclobacteriaceae bacterium]
MKKYIALFFPLMICLVAMKAASSYRHIPQKALHPGEKISYKVNYGVINAGEALMVIDDKVHKMNNRPCYKVDIHGRTVGFFDVAIKIRDNWGSYIDTSAIVSQQFYQYIEEGKYKKKEIIDFDHKNGKAISNKLDKNTGELKEKKVFPVPQNMQDIVSGYYYLRTLNFDTIKINDVFEIQGFFDDTVYHIGIEYLGKEKLKTKIGTFEALVISPIVPQNKFFSGRNPVKAWISDDDLKIPLKVRANLIVGGLEINIKDYEKGATRKPPK